MAEAEAGIGTAEEGIVKAQEKLDKAAEKLEQREAELAEADESDDKAVDKATKNLEKAKDGVVKAQEAVDEVTVSVDAARAEVDTARANVETVLAAAASAGDDLEGISDDDLPAAVKERREFHPHESPWQMTVPLILLSAAAVIAGVMNLPFSKDLHFLEKWLEPTLYGNKHKLGLSGGELWILAIIAVVIGAVGIAAAVAIYLQKRIPAEKVELPILARGWRYDEAVSDFMGGPGRKGFDLVAWFDATIVDGIVNGTGRLVRTAGGGLRTLQTGLVRSYAALVAVGAVGLIAVPREDDLLMSSLFAASSADVPFPILSALVVTLFLGALLMLVLPNGRPEYFKQVAFLVSGAVAGMTAWVMVEFDKHTADEFQFVDSAEWIAGLGISWTLGLDGISLWLVVLTAACSRSPSLRSRPSTRRRRTTRGCSCWRRGSWACSSPSTCSPSSCSSRSCWSRCTSSSASGVTGLGPTPRPSSSCTRCSVRHSCSSASSLRRSSPQPRPATPCRSISSTSLRNRHSPPRRPAGSS